MSQPINAADKLRRAVEAQKSIREAARKAGEEIRAAREAESTSTSGESGAQ